MTENVNNVDFNSSDVLELIEGDAELSKLPLGSEDLKAALNDKLSKTVEGSNDADADENEDDVDADSDQDDADHANEGKKKPRGVLRRIEKLVTRNHNLERQLKELQHQLEQVPQKMVTEAVGEFEFDVAKPNIANFDNISDYTEALTEWKMEFKEAKKAFEEQKSEMIGKVAEIANTWTAKEAEVKKQFKDYSAVVNIDAVVEANPSQQAKDFLAESDVGPLVIYHMLADEDLAEEFAKASAAKQVRMLAKLELELTNVSDEPSSVASTDKKTLKLPSPLPKGKPTAVVLDPIKDASRMSDADWDKHYEATMAAKRRR